MSGDLNQRQVSSFGPGPVSLPIPSLGPLPSPTTSPPGLPLPTKPVDTSSTTPATTVTFPGGTLTIPLPTLPSPSQSTNTSSSTASSTAPSSTPSGSPSFKITTPSNVTTCTPLQIQWSVSNPEAADLSHTTLAIIITNIGLKRDTVNMTLVAEQPLLSNAYTWPAVNVAPGDYAIRGVEGDFTSQSGAFSVQAGSNTSCIAPSGSGAGDTAASSTAKSTHAGAIAGGTIGGVLILACIGVAFFFLSGVRKGSSKRGRSGRRGWGGLGSFDSKGQAAQSGDSHDYLSASAAAAAGRGSALSGRAAPAASAISLDGEKAVVGGDDRIVPVLSHHANWSNGNGVDDTPRTSVELAHLPSRPTPIATAAQDSPRSSFDFTDPFVSTPTGNAQSRRASRTPRKPVPAYQPTTEELDAMAVARTRSDRSQHSRSSISHQPSSPSSPSAYAHQVSSSLSTTATSNDPLVHGLKSKSSGHFDNQPVHYLIPDMPPQQRADY